MKKIKLFALAVMAMLGTNAMAQALVSCKTNFGFRSPPLFLLKGCRFVRGLRGCPSSLREVFGNIFTQNIMPEIQVLWAKRPLERSSEQDYHSLNG